MQGASKKIALEKIKVIVAILLVVSGIAAFYFFAQQSTFIRLGALFGAVLLAFLVFVFSESGKQFFAFGKDTTQEVRKVVWPTRKEAVQVTLVVFLFVLVTGIFLFGVDKTLEFVLYDLILGWKK